MLTDPGIDPTSLAAFVTNMVCDVGSAKVRIPFTGVAAAMYCGVQNTDLSRDPVTDAMVMWGDTVINNQEVQVQLVRALQRKGDVAGQDRVRRTKP